MKEIDLDDVAKVVIPHFLRSLMKIERERQGISRKQASVQSGWSSSAWGKIERNVTLLPPQKWIEAVDTLEMGADNVVRRLNAFIGKHPMLWIERRADNELAVCDRPINDHALRSGNIINVDLNKARPNLYYEISLYSPNQDEIIETANSLGMIHPRRSQPAAQIVPSRDSTAHADALRNHISTALEPMSAEKLGLLERIIDKFEHCSAAELAQAYKHFSLSISQKP